jgi:hypothetical protein
MSRQCICPFCTKEADKLTIKNQNLEKYLKSEEINDENAKKETEDEVKIELINDNSSEIIVVNELIPIKSSDDSQCKLYNNVIAELKNKLKPKEEIAVEMDETTHL